MSWDQWNFILLILLWIPVLGNLGLELYRLWLVRHCQMRQCCQTYPELFPDEQCVAEGCAMIRDLTKGR